VLDAKLKHFGRDCSGTVCAGRWLAAGVGSRFNSRRQRHASYLDTVKRVGGGTGSYSEVQPGHKKVGAVVTQVGNHDALHYGNLVTYLRLNGLEPSGGWF
jgi:hypothetical protein